MMLSASHENQEIIELEEERGIALPEIVRSEVNFLTFPFFALRDKDVYKKSKTQYKAVVKRGDEKLEILWKVSANPDHGYPGPFDREVHKAVEQIIENQKPPIQNPIRLGSLRSLARIRGLHTQGGEVLKEIKESLQRIMATTITSKGAFYHKGEQQWIEDIFHLYDRVVFKGKKMPDGRIADTNYLFLNSWYLDNINARYVKPIDWNYYHSLKTPIATRLYELLSVKFFGLGGKEKFIRYRYSTLCNLLPITRQKYLSDAKSILNPAHQELKETEFLADYLWEDIPSTQPERQKEGLVYPLLSRKKGEE